MKFRIEEIRVPSIRIETIEGKVNYIEGEPEIRIEGYKNREDIKLVESSKVMVRLSDLPQDLRDLWENFKTKVENWVNTQETD